MTNYAYISNLTAPNWVYGNISSAEYYIRMFKFITTHNITSCPETAPFVLANSTQCSQCYNPTPLYDANTMTCIASCPNGTTFNSALHTCVADTNCQYPGQVYNATSQSCYCPVSSPYFTGSACVACIAPNYWNDTAKVCSSCDIRLQQYYNIQQNACTTCPAYAPISTGLTCVNCNQTSYYNTTLNTCVSCPDNRLFNPVSQRCECPANAPFFNGTGCSLCAQYQIYNKTTNQC